MKYPYSDLKRKRDTMSGNMYIDIFIVHMSRKNFDVYYTSLQLQLQLGIKKRF